MSFEQNTKSLGTYLPYITTPQVRVVVTHLALIGFFPEDRMEPQVFWEVVVCNSRVMPLS